VRPDPGRRPVTRREFVQAHFRAGSRPAGHGFTAANGADGTAYYVHDTPAVRLIALDTTCLSGGSAGCLDHDQARWLADRLAEVHSAYRATDGALVRTGNQDRLVVVFSHHGTTTLTNSGCGGGNGAPPLGAHDVCALLHRFGNVVLWLNGHTHTNAVRAHRDPAHPAAGFWEVTTCAVVDWPCQTRLVELVAGRGRLAIVCTMVDHDSPDRPGRLDLERADGDGSLAGLASLHRELAANVPIIGAHWGREGAPADRNVILNMAPPFPPRRLGP
jgi:hypothetical protein